MIVRLSTSAWRGLAAVMAIGLSSLNPPTADAASSDPARIVVKDFMFKPVSLSVKVGTTVVWTNEDDEPHTVRSETRLFASGALDTNESYSFRFDKPGTYVFFCSIHPRMTGTVVVE